MIDVEVKTTDPAVVAFIEMSGPYDQIPAGMGQLYGWVGRKGFEPIGMPSGVYLTEPGATAETDAAWELRAPVAGEPETCAPDESGCGVKRVEPSLVASTMHRGPYESIASTYEELVAWTGENGYAIVGPPEEFYYSDPATTSPEEYLTEIRFAVEKQ
jgi:effector-binding domain-containing protein